ncbi:hypothetical protein Y032_0239g3307 [Ancylostoma ceylanicum]|uniref:Uncharacterized protein n=1 Tax=Ancylostoma ceylanicum TaxID=53326 RepID=A0A016SF49_9BILA|nr:hypothetical protein Y032_0239g3307 [Ancylostoma ceylanicum]
MSQHWRPLQCSTNEKKNTRASSFSNIKMFKLFPRLLLKKQNHSIFIRSKHYITGDNNSFPFCTRHRRRSNDAHCAHFQGISKTFRVQPLPMSRQKLLSRMRRAEESQPKRTEMRIAACQIRAGRRHYPRGFRNSFYTTAAT